MREPGQIKRSPRVDTRFEATLIDSDGSKHSVIVTDISREGCRLETSDLLKIGESVQIEVPKYGLFPAQIRWALGDEAGAVFLEPIFLP
ncbi:PilZ domain-containing protein [Sphingomonas sp.]|uniref:PilZ domain-containing protein n=1 Tax=Sphingomonas sp. TaxID=28214 RepID=UPI0025DF4EE1|nr:PilZ domain-containing protein [Sphingomonas sp.]